MCQLNKNNKQVLAYSNPRLRINLVFLKKQLKKGIKEIQSP